MPTLTLHRRTLRRHFSADISCKVLSAKRAQVKHSHAQFTARARSLFIRRPFSRTSPHGCGKHTVKMAAWTELGEFYNAWRHIGVIFYASLGAINAQDDVEGPGRDGKPISHLLLIWLTQQAPISCG